ncbi:hypothetical protein Poli38472_012455 [Pythium oligandrum]|uniref:Uncharacterized protein n=1 Tax=Pythium oligandrum TaxID=41045 RepID=A0A8K1CQE5_PYTOL|nr:hypothetical protein Poli38472_012455 [Pythium oligandrum]|eukprot:TMW67339.1 hypothetical protein Poli38472_012455 [Pythium oligandrum]
MPAHSTAIVPAGPTKPTAWDNQKIVTLQRSKVWQFFGHKLAELKHVARLKNRKKLQDAIMRGSLADVMEQLAFGADVNVRSTDGETPLHLAAARGYHQIMVVLIDRGAEVNVVTNDGVTPLYVACEKNHEEAVKLLLLEKARVDLPVMNVTGYQPIHIAAKNGCVGIVKMLLKYGAKVDAITKPRLLTPLMLASKVGASEVVELLLDRGADPDQEDRDGNTPLHFSCSEGQYRATYLLLTAGADPDMPNGREETPFDVAEHQGFSHITYLLETNGMGAPDQNMYQVDNAFANDSQLVASLERNRPELAEIIVRNRVRYAQFYTLGCITEDDSAEDEYTAEKLASSGVPL